METEHTYWPRRRWMVGLFVAAVCVMIPSVATTYVGPGAGIAFMSTALALLSTVLVVVLGAVLWPIRWVWVLLTQKKPEGEAQYDRVVIVGLDGIDPDVVDELVEAGKLPNFKRILDKGGIHRLKTTYPAMSPVAWSSFSTGVNPGKHGIYDFLTRDPRTYAPDLSSAKVRPPAKFLKLGPYQIPISKPRVRLLKRSKAFWRILGTYRVPSAILRVPVTFPPDEFEGTMLSAMCVPDMQGSQGTFTYLVEESHLDEARAQSLGDDEFEDPYAVGMTRPIVFDDDRARSEVVMEGPPNPIRTDGERLTTTIAFTLDDAHDRVLVEMGDEKIMLAVDEYSDWLEISFKMGLGLKLRGICRLRVLELNPLRVYVSPINIDPGRPVLPISHPRFFSVFLSKLIGPFATLGLAEDTWALNEGVLDDDGFLEQAWLNHDEREEMMFQMLRRTPKGLVTCVFDGTDRIQHMFWRYRDDAHPAVTDDAKRAKYKSVIDDTYITYDEMLGRVLKEVDIDSGKEMLAVMSDHGFASFRRGINLNTWLHEQGYLVLKDGAEMSGEWFRGVDWTQTKAFALGLGGIFLNIEGREEFGIVAPGEEAEQLAAELADKLRGMVDPKTGEVAIGEVYLASEIYDGPYVDEAPSIIIGYNRGWRASWDGARGKVTDVIFDDNTKAWSGDHCIDPTAVPGVLMSSAPLQTEDGGDPSIMDVAPTVLDYFGIRSPAYMDGTSLAHKGKETA